MVTIDYEAAISVTISDKAAFCKSDKVVYKWFAVDLAK